MKQRILGSLLAILALAAAGCAAPGMVPGGTVRTEGTKFKARSLKSPKNLFAPRQLLLKGQATPVAGATVKGRLGDYQLHELPKGMAMAEAIAAYERAPGVTAIEQLELFPVEDDTPKAALPAQAPMASQAANDPRYFQQWSHVAAKVPEAWAVTQGRPDVVVAVIDSGVDYTHPDLQGQVINGPCFADNSDDSKDLGSHGTHVAGIIAAKANNGVGVAGVAPNAKVLALRTIAPVLDEQGRFRFFGSNEFAIARAIHYAATQGGAKVINLSLSLDGGGMMTEMLQLARGKGLIICTSAGNGGNNTFTRNDRGMSTPKFLDGLLVVHATDAEERLATFSNYGGLLDLSAPGAGILSTVPSYANPFTGEQEDKSGYASWDGTSMASPFVAGVAALVVSGLYDKVAPLIKNAGGGAIRPTDIPGKVVEDILRSSATDLGRPGRDEVYGVGRVNAERAVALSQDPNYVRRAAIEVLENRGR